MWVVSCVSPHFNRLLWTLKWGNCEDCGNTGVDPVCVLVCHYCHVKCSSALRNLRENSTPLQLFLVASTLIINIDFSGYLQKGIAYLLFQSNILSCCFADLLNAHSQISPVELWLLFYSHQTPWQSWTWVTIIWEILEFSFSLTDCPVPTANCRH